MENQKFNDTGSKAQARVILKKILKSLSQERRAQASQDACALLYQESRAASFVLSFASFGFEIDLWPLNRQWMQEQRLVLPRLENNHLTLFLVTQYDHLEKHAFGMLEPIPSLCQVCDPSTMNIALIPGLGFDLLTNHRLGYGLGYYDRLLYSTPIVKTWGVGFLEQSMPALPYTAQDMPLHRITLF